MIVQNLPELMVVEVSDRGLPNHERIVISVEDTTNMGQYGMMLGIRTQNGTAVPIRDHLFWFGDGVVKKGDFLLLYTGSGEARNTQIGDTDSVAYTLHWGKSSTVFANPAILPILFRMDAIDIIPDPVDRPQLPLNSK